MDEPPIGGFNTQPTISVMASPRTHDHLPMIYTCFLKIILPRSPTQQAFFSKFDAAFSQGLIYASDDPLTEDEDEDENEDEDNDNHYGVPR